MRLRAKWTPGAFNLDLIFSGGGRERALCAFGGASLHGLSLRQMSTLLEAHADLEHNSTGKFWLQAIYSTHP